MRRLGLTSSFSRSEKTKQKNSFISFGAKETNQRKHSPNQGLPPREGCNSKIGETTILTSSKLLTLNRLKASLSSVFANPQF